MFDSHCLTSLYYCFPSTRISRDNLIYKFIFREIKNGMLFIFHNTDTDINTVTTKMTTCVNVLKVNIILLLTFNFHAPNLNIEIL